MIAQRKLIALIGLGVMGLSGCSDSIQRYEKLYNASAKILSGETTQSHVTRAVIEQESRASAKIIVEGFQPIFLPVIEFKDDTVVYQSKDNKRIEIKGGRVVKIIGFEPDLIRTQIQPNDGAVFRSLLPQKGQVIETTRYHDYYVAGQPETETLDCKMTREDAETIEIMEYTYQTIRYQERCEQKNGRWRWSNYFWADEKTGFIWKSTQELSAKKLHLSIEITKPLSDLLGVNP